MQRTWGIARKGLILISVPLAFELMFLFVIGSLLAQTQVQLDSASRSRQIVACADDVGRMLLQLSAVAGAHRIFPKPELKDRFLSLKSEILDGYDYLDYLAQQNDSAEDLQELRESRKVLEACFKSLDEFQSQAQPGSLQAILTSSRAKDVREQTNAIGHAMMILVKREEDAAVNSAKVREALMLRVQLFLAGGFLVNGLITVYLAWYFWRGFASRVSCVMENSARLASRTPLLNPLDGTDEIAQLDRAFHDAVRELTELERGKRALTMAITKRIEAPLQEVSDITHAFLSNEFGRLDEKTESRLHSAASSSERLMRLLNDLRGPANIRDSTGFALKFREVNVLSVVQTAFATVEQLASDRNISLNSEVDSSIAIEADRDRLIQVVVNLLSNAIKYSPDGGVVTVAAELENGSITISVSDQGPGIDKQFHDKIFGLYEQVHARDSAEKGGSGLGLVICKNIIRRHKGSISVKSALGEGTTFVVELPVSQAPKNTSGGT